MTGQTVSHYRVGEKVGAGGMGVVYGAQDSVLGRAVAIKFLPPDASADQQALERFMREARLAAALNHPNICTIHEVGEHEGVPFLVMELLEGGTLKEHIEKIRPGLDRVLDLGMQIADALQAAHSKGITHRDIKPTNIYVTGSGQAKVLDFGLARLTHLARAAASPRGSDVEDTIGDRNLTSPGTTVGTIAYMSPEQARGEDLDARTDLFSFGAVLYEIATGQVAFPGSTSAVVFDNILHGTPKPPSRINSNLPPEFDRIIAKALEKDIEMRYQTALDIKGDLKRLKRDLESGKRTAVGPGSSSDRAIPVPAQIASEKSVAVLYFENLSGTKEDEYFRDGMTEDIITEISKISRIRAFSRSEVLAFRDKQVVACQVGQQLAAEFVLEGSIRRAGNRLRITAQLVESASRHSVWAERYDRQMEDVFAIQDEIARSIAQALSITLSPQEEKKIARKPTENPQAYDYFLRGRSYLRRWDLNFALQMYEHAIELDPKFALAHAGVASVCGMTFEYQHQDPAWIQRGLAACEKALALEPTLAEVLAARAWLFSAQKKYEDAIQYALRAIELKPDCEGAYSILGRAYFASGRYEEAVAMVDRAIEFNGDDYNVYIPYYNSLSRMGRVRTTAILREKQTRALEKQVGNVPEDVRARMLLACKYAEESRSDEATRHLETALALRPGDSNVLYNAACAYALMSRKTEALETLRRAVEAGWSNLDWVARDPDFVCLHNDPEFQSIVGVKADAPQR